MLDAIHEYNALKDRLKLDLRGYLRYIAAANMILFEMIKDKVYMNKAISYTASQMKLSKAMVGSMILGNDNSDRSKVREAYNHLYDFFTSQNSKYAKIAKYEYDIAKNAMTIAKEAIKEGKNNH